MVYAYQMLQSFKTSVTYKNNSSFTPDKCVRCETAFIGQNSIFCRTLSDVRYFPVKREFIFSILCYFQIFHFSDKVKPPASSPGHLVSLIFNKEGSRSCCMKFN